MALQTTPTHPDADSYVTLTEADAYFSNRTDVTDWDALTDDQKEASLKLATKQIDSLRFFNKKIFPDAMHYRREQALKFPTIKEYIVNGTVDSATSTTVVDAQLANNTNYPDDYFNSGAIVIIDGTGKGQTVKVTDFVMSTGTLTTDSFSTTPDSTSQYMLILEAPQEVKDATCEQALYIVKGGGQRQALQSEGVVEYKIGDLSERFGEGGGSNGVAISDNAMGYLRGFVSKIGKLI